MTSRISAFARPAKFVDEMESGPFHRWRHEHRFEDSDGSTLMSDVIAYELPLGPLGRLADALFVRRHLTHLVQQHNRAVKAAAEEEKAPRPVASP
jgi:ligand-binding SRPBCC domain-containing protein